MKPALKKQVLWMATLGAILVLLVSSQGRSLPFLLLPLGFVALRRSWLGLKAARNSPPSGPRVPVLPPLLRGAFGVLVIVIGLVLLVGRMIWEANRPSWRQGRYGQRGEFSPPRFRPEATTTNFTSNHPIVVLHAENSDLSSGATLLVQAEFIDTDPATRRASLGAPAAYDGLISIHVRGSSSQRLPKSSYTFHTMENRTNQVKVPLLGLPKEEDWVLYAPFEDKTLIRDVLAYELARRSGHYAPRTRFVELFVTRTPGRPSLGDYMGVYVLVEKIKRGSSRVDIAKLAPDPAAADSLSGGYIVKRDHPERGETRFMTHHGGPYFFVYPDARKVTAQQRTWLTRYFTTFEAALHDPGFADPVTGYAAYLDVASFIDAHWLIEMSKNVDGFRYSAFITKDRGGKLKTEPPWDWNRSFGNANYYGGWQPEGWYWPRLRPTEISWYHRLREDPEFVRRCNARWLELRRDVFDPARILQTIDALAVELDEAQKRNFQRWPILGERVTCNHFVGDTYEEEVRWMKKWIVNRIAWIDRQVSTHPDAGAPGREE